MAGGPRAPIHDAAARTGLGRGRAAQAATRQSTGGARRLEGARGGVLRQVWARRRCGALGIPARERGVGGGQRAVRHFHALHPLPRCSEP
eukprot:3136797-Prymnesium_polylepis.2